MPVKQQPVGNTIDGSSYPCGSCCFFENRLTAYAEQYPDQCKLTEDDAVIGCKSFEIAKGRLSFRLTAPYSEERRRVASECSKSNMQK